MAKIKKYRCLNFGNCEKAGKKEQFEIPEGGEMKCPECGSEMIQEVKSSNGMMIAIIVAAVVALAVAAFALLRGSDKEEKVQEEETTEIVEEATVAAEDSVQAAEAAARQAKEDSIAAAAAAAAAEAEAKAKEDSIKAAEEAAKAKGKTPAVPSNYLTNARCEYGLYTGPAVNGKPGGGLGTIKVQGSHSINLNNARKETIDITTGDTILNAKFADGRLVSGLVRFANGQARQFNVGV